MFSLSPASSLGGWAEAGLLLPRSRSRLAVPRHCRRAAGRLRAGSVPALPAWRSAARQAMHDHPRQRHCIEVFQVLVTSPDGRGGGRRAGSRGATRLTMVQLPAQEAEETLWSPSSNHSSLHPLLSFSSAPTSLRPLIQDFRSIRGKAWV